MKNKDVLSYSTENIKHQRNIVLFMSIMPLLVMVLLAGVFYQVNRNNLAKAALIFSTGFENGSLSEWSGGQCMRSYSCTASTNAPRSGNYSSRYEVRDGDCPITGDQCYGERAEKQGGTIGSNMSSNEGQNRWYSWSMKLEDGFPNSTRWQVISQWHSANNGSPAVAYYISGRSMYMQHYDPNVGYVQHWYGTPLNTGQWIDLKMNIYWTSSTSGYVRLWINGQEQSRYNGATLRAGEGTYFKQGYYRDQAVSGTGIVYYDNLKAATSEADLGGTTTPPAPAPVPVPAPSPPPPAPNPNPAPSGQSPYTGSAQTLPGQVEAENYDNGGEGVAYHDTSSTNVTGKYRNDGVDIENATGGGYNVGYNDPGEWREHTVNIPSGTYNISARVSSAVDGGQLVIKLGSTTIATINVPNSGGWQSYQNPSVANIAISGGNAKILRFETAGNSYTIDSVTFTKQGTQTNPGPTPQPTPSPSPTPNPSTPPPPVSIPDANPTTPVEIPQDLPTQEDGTQVGDFNGDGLNDIVKDLNNDGKIDPTKEVVIDGTKNTSLTDTFSPAITPEEYANLTVSQDDPIQNKNNTITVKVGPLPEVTIARPVAYTFLIAQGVAITGIGTYLAITKLAFFAGFRGRWGL